MKSVAIVFGLLCTYNLSAAPGESSEPENNIPMNSCSAAQLEQKSLMALEEISGLDLVEIEEEEVILGYDTYFYLPANFNPYKGMSIDLEEVTVEEPEENIDLGFNTDKYLPEGFNPYSCSN
ncbi:hypothetical protein [Maribacter sp. R77961]|uniref:hypothetical protein n=1 Tax=Maribacter sp. R77961 TaxID=3093871 RepID=UPI0037C90CBE